MQGTFAQVLSIYKNNDFFILLIINDIQFFAQDEHNEARSNLSQQEIEEFTAISVCYQLSLMILNFSIMIFPSLYFWDSS